MNKMLYAEFINQACALTITQADNSLFYLEPMWESILEDNNLKYTDVSDRTVNAVNVYPVLSLEVEKRNTINSLKPAVLQWVYEIITAQIEPAILDEQTDYVKAVTDFVKANHEAQALKDKES